MSECKSSDPGCTEESLLEYGRKCIESSRLSPRVSADIGPSSLQSLNCGVPFVDRSMYIPYFLAKSRVLMLRPKGFGKTTWLQLLSKVFSSSDLTGLAINSLCFACKGMTYNPSGVLTQAGSVEQHSFTPRPVLHLDLAGLHLDLAGSRRDLADSRAEAKSKLDATVDSIITKEAERNGILVSASVSGWSDRLKSLIEKLHETKGPIVLLVDNYDDLLLLCADWAIRRPVEEALEMFFSILKSHSKYCFMSVVTGVSRRGVQVLFTGSDAFIDLTFDPYTSDLLGFTADEASLILTKANASPERVASVLSVSGGYSFDSESCGHRVHNSSYVIQSTQRPGQSGEFFICSASGEQCGGLVDAIQSWINPPFDCRSNSASRREVSQENLSQGGLDKHQAWSAGLTLLYLGLLALDKRSTSSQGEVLFTLRMPNKATAQSVRRAYFRKAKGTPHARLGETTGATLAADPPNWREFGIALNQLFTEAAKDVERSYGHMLKSPWKREGAHDPTVNRDRVCSLLEEHENMHVIPSWHDAEGIPCDSKGLKSCMEVRSRVYIGPTGNLQVNRVFLNVGVSYWGALSGSEDWLKMSDSSTHSGCDGVVELLAVLGQGPTTLALSTSGSSHTTQDLSHAGDLTHAGGLMWPLDPLMRYDRSVMNEWSYIEENKVQIKTFVALLAVDPNTFFVNSMMLMDGRELRFTQGPLILSQDLPNGLHLPSSCVEILPSNEYHMRLFQCQLEPLPAKFGPLPAEQSAVELRGKDGHSTISLFQRLIKEGFNTLSLLSLEMSHLDRFGCLSEAEKELILRAAAATRPSVESVKKRCASGGAAQLLGECVWIPEELEYSKGAIDPDHRHIEVLAAGLSFKSYRGNRPPFTGHLLGTDLAVLTMRAVTDLGTVNLGSAVNLGGTVVDLEERVAKKARTGEGPVATTGTVQLLD